MRSKRPREQTHPPHRGLEFDFNPRLTQAFKFLSSALSLIVGIGSLLVLLGGALATPILKSVSPSWVTMKLNTASAFSLAGLSLWLWNSKRTVRWKISLARICAILVASMGVLASILGRMMPNTAVSFLLVGLALLFLDVETRRGIRPSQVIALAGGCIAVMALLAYLYGPKDFDGTGTSIQITFLTAVVFTILFAAILCAHPNRGVMAVVTSNNLDGVSARRLLPIALFLPAVFGWLYLLGQRVGLYGIEFGVAFFVIVSTFLLAAFVYFNAKSLPGLDLKRKHLEGLQDIVESAPNGFVIVNRQGRIVIVNNQAEKLFGYSRGELMDQLIEILVPERYRGRHPGYREAFFQNPERRVMGVGRDLYAVRKDGTEFPIEIGLSPVLTREGTMAIVSLIDITERKKAEEQISSQAAALAAAANAIMITNRGGRIQWVNPAFTKLTGWLLEEIKGKTARILKSDQHDPPFYKEMWETILAGKVWHGELVNRRKDGGLYPHELTITPVFDKEGRIGSFVGISQDITERKRAEAMRERLVAQLESVNKELGDFTYTVSHDLKAPLRGIDLLAGWIAEDCGDKLDEEGEKRLGMLQARVRKMHALINGILEYSRIGRTEEDIVEFDLDSVLTEVIESLQPPSHIQIEVQKDLPLLCGSRVRIEQLFQNLLGNAIKYMDKSEGKIKVGCEAEGAFWRFSVSDNGPGIEKKYHERIFEFSQTLGQTKKSDSTGIGLSLVKKIVELYGGKVWLRSERGQGSAFYFTFPKNLTKTGEGFNDQCASRSFNRR